MGGGPVTNIPINSCRSGYRHVNLEGLGCEGGNESIKGSIVQSPASTPPKHLALALSTWVDTVGRKRGEKGRFPPRLSALKTSPPTMTFHPAITTAAIVGIHLSGDTRGFKNVQFFYGTEALFVHQYGCGSNLPDGNSNSALNVFLRNNFFIWQK